MKTKVMTAKKATTIVTKLPTKVQVALDSDYASQERAEHALDKLEVELGQKGCSVQFALARAFQMGVAYANELHEREIRQAERATVR